ncbi:ribonuclease Z [Halonotius terrestris]|uniref:Ribonuclease Z n=1 Tax=Halonotius terrestris TaxID=2487750 RepID=A0A8J8PA49_9EURY|nr:ribonuclease Z [Halonotius terrestris]TQQ82701.1 ribonuclease Z [Halonotius terrestris]
MSLRVTFLGTSGAVPTTQRAPSAVFVNREGDRLLFDCGEGTQRQMMRYNTGFTVSHIFVTHLHGDHILGIPGLIQSWDFNGRDEPLTIHCPRGTYSEINSLLSVGGHSPSFRIEIEEVAPGEAAHETDEYAVRAFETDHRITSVGYALIEADRAGRFDREKAEDELGIPPGPLYGKLHDGERVELDDGRVIEPDQVVGDPRPGRRFVYTGDTRPTDAAEEIAADADLLIHDATFADDHATRARETSHATGREAGELAARAGAKRLALTHISSRYAADASPIREEAAEAFDGDVFIATDGQEIEVPFPDNDAVSE